jgi:hypothetical protein
MKTKKSIKAVVAAAGALVVAAIAGTMLSLPSARAQDSGSEQAKIQLGLKLAPVTLNMKGLDSNLVGFGSYLVNAAMGCNDCHSAGAQTAYVAGGNPYFGQHPTKVNPATYMGGGNDFGAFPDPAGPFPHIVSRNLTPDKSGLPIGGDSYDKFVQVMRTGVDPDTVHPTCAGPPDKTCVPAPFDGKLLQIMPWPLFQNLVDHDLQAIYEYLRAIPCVEGGPGEPANRCGTTGPKTAAVAGPKNATVTGRELVLDGTQSTSADGKALTYAWTIPQGSPSAAIRGGTTATPTVQFSTARGAYTFQLTVTDSAGKSATDLVTVNYQGN